jgi:hypothetical protein
MLVTDAARRRHQFGLLFMELSWDQLRLGLEVPQPCRLELFPGGLRCFRRDVLPKEDACRSDETVSVLPSDHRTL